MYAVQYSVRRTSRELPERGFTGSPVVATPALNQKFSRGVAYNVTAAPLSSHGNESGSLVIIPFMIPLDTALSYVTLKGLVPLRP